MKKSLLILALVISCGTEGQRGRSGESCTVIESSEGSLVKCGASEVLVKNGTNGTNGTNGVDGKSGTNGTDGKSGTNGKDYVAPTTLEGFYSLPNGGYLELVENFDKDIIVFGTQRIYSPNSDKSLALYPTISTTPFAVRNGKIVGEQSLAYTALANGLKIDATNADISGTRKTTYTFSRTDTGKLLIEILVYSSTGLSIEATRKITSL